LSASKYAVSYLIVFIVDSCSDSSLLIIYVVVNYNHVGGLSLPSDRWQEIMMDLNKKIQALEIDYENICIENKVSIRL